MPNKQQLKRPTNLVQQLAHLRPLRMEALEERLPLTLIGVPSTTLGDIDFAGDYDSYTFEATAGALYDIRTTAGTLTDTHVLLLDKDGETELAEGSSSGDVEPSSSVRWTAPSDGIYLLEVRAGAGFGFHFGDYTIDIETIAYDDDHGNAVGMATPVAVPSQTPGVLNTRGESDVFSIAATENLAYTFSVQGNFGFADTIVTVRDTSGSAIAVSEINQSLEWVAPTVGNYFVDVRGTNPLNNSNYTFFVQSANFSDDHGNSPTTATAISVPSTTAGSLQVPADVDFFSFSAAANMTYIFSATFAVDLQLYDIDGTTEINYFSRGGSPIRFYSWKSSFAGTYFVQVTSGDATGSPAYQLGIETLADDHGNSLTQATPLEVPSTTNGKIGLPDDVDYFSFVATANTLYEVVVVGGAQVEVRNGDAAVSARSTSLVWLAPADGTYYLRVNSFAPVDYTLELSTTSYSDDHGNAFNTATPIAIPSQTLGENEIPFDGDFFAFAATADTIYNFSFTDETTAVIELYDVNGTTLLQRGRNSYLNWEAPADGNYFVRISEAAGAYGLVAAALADDHGTNVQEATTVAIPSATPGTLDFRDDRDYLQFDAIVGQIYDISVSSSELADVRLRLLRPDGVSIVRDANSEAGSNVTSLGNWRGESNGSYFLEVRDFSQSGSYSVEVVAIDYNDDHGNTPATGTLLAIPSTLMAFGEIAEDIDYFSFQATAGTLYQFTTFSVDLFLSNRVDPPISPGSTWLAPQDGTYDLFAVELAEYTVGIAVLDYADDHANIAALATPIAVPSMTMAEGEVDGDVDYFSFEATAGSLYEIVAPSLQLYDTDGITLLSPLGPGQWLAPQAGTYFFSAEAPGAYSVEITTAADDDHGNLPELATVLNVPSVTPGVIETEFDRDFFVFAALAGTRYNLIASSQTVAHLRLLLFDTDGVAELDAGGHLGIETNATVSWVAPADGNYYLSTTIVGDLADGVYDLTAELAALDDHGNGSESATPILVPSNTPGKINLLDDVDVFSFTASAGTLYAFSLSGTLPYSQLTIIDTDGATELTSNVAIPVGSFASLGWSAPGDGAYFVKVSRAFTPDLGSYALHVESLVTDDHGGLYGQATSVTVPSATDGVIENGGDVDFFAFETTAGTLYQFSTTVGTLNSTLLRLYDTDGNSQLRIDSVGAQGTPSFIRWVAPAQGNYYLAVQGTANNVTGSYQLALETVVYADDHANLPAQGTTLVDGFVTAGDLESRGDTDFFSFQANVGSLYRLFTTAGTLLDTALQLYDTDGTTKLRYNDDDNVSGASSIRWIAPTSGTYYLEVFDSGQLRTGEYGAAFETISYTDDHGNVSTAASLVTVPSMSAGAFEVNDDTDFFSFEAISGTTYDIYTTAGTLDDTTLRLYGIDGISEIAFNDDDGQSTTSRILWTAPVAGTYFVEVAAWDPGSFFIVRTGDYGLNIEEAPVLLPCDYVDAGDGCDIADLNALYAGENGAPTPLTNALIVEWLSEASSTENLSKASPSDVYRLGDVDLNGDVNSADLGLLLNAFGADDGLGWGNGNLNDDQVVDSLDLGILLNNFGFESPSFELPCDYLGGGNGCDIADLDALYAGTNGAPLPLNNASISQWLVDASSNDNPLKVNPADVYLFGDVDLDGNVDSIDLGLLLNAFGDESGLGWGSGNLNDDAIVNSADLGLLLNNFAVVSQGHAAAEKSTPSEKQTGWSVRDFVFRDIENEESNHDGADAPSFEPFRSVRRINGQRE